jgi:hypothetical protein
VVTTEVSVARDEGEAVADADVKVVKAAATAREDETGTAGFV